MISEIFSSRISTQHRGKHGAVCNVFSQVFCGMAWTLHCSTAQSVTLFAVNVTGILFFQTELILYVNTYWLHAFLANSRDLWSTLQMKLGSTCELCKLSLGLDGSFSCGYNCPKPVKTITWNPQLENWKKPTWMWTPAKCGLEGEPENYRWPSDTGWDPRPEQGCRRQGCKARKPKYDLW